MAVAYCNGHPHQSAYKGDEKLRRTSLLLCELPAKAFLKLAWGSAMLVCPLRTTHPVPSGQPRHDHGWCESIQTCYNYEEEDEDLEDTQTLYTGLAIS